MPSHNGKVYPALLDTGADHCALDEAAAADIGVRLFGNGYAHGWGGHAKQVQKASVQILIPSANVIFLTEVAVLDFRRAGQQWDVLLGRSFLHHCRLFADGPSGRYELEWVA